uniref:Uncharacterized protein n=1 Tax=Timema tahoe TaxID=61484 RepID=A0A7R9ISK2_9NEOP|nr:unnamed protein product [Timema tahoe]
MTAKLRAVAQELAGTGVNLKIEGARAYRPRAFKSLPSQGLQESKSLPSQGLQESKSLTSKGRQDSKSLTSQGRQDSKILPSQSLQELTVPRPSREQESTVPGPSIEQDAYHPRAFKRARAYRPRAVKIARAYRPRAFKSLPSQGLQESKSLPSQGPSREQESTVPGPSREQELIIPNLQASKSLLSQGLLESTSLPSKGRQSKSRQQAYSIFSYHVTCERSVRSSSLSLIVSSQYSVRQSHQAELLYVRICVLSTITTAQTLRSTARARDKTNAVMRLGVIMPNFWAQTTKGPLQFYDYLGTSSFSRVYVSADGAFCSRILQTSPPSVRRNWAGSHSDTMSSPRGTSSCWVIPATLWRNTGFGYRLRLKLQVKIDPEHGKYPG